MVVESTKAPAQDVAAAHAAAYDDPIEQQALEHVWIHSANYVELAERQGLHVFDHGKGCMLYDVHGDEWIDGIAGLWVVNAGHGRQEIGDAMAEQAGQTRLRLRRVVHLRPGRPTRGDDRRTDARRPRARLLLLRRLGGGRVRAEDRQAGAGAARLPEAVQDHRPARLLPRRDLRRDEPDDRQPAAGRALLRPADGRRRPCPLAEPLPQRLRPGGRSGRHHVRQVGRAGDHLPGAGDGRGGDRRADLLRERRPCPLAEVLADAARDLRPARRPAHHGRGDQRLRAHRQVVRDRALRRRAGHHDDGEGPLQRLRADRGGGRAPERLRGLHAGTRTPSTICSPSAGRRSRRRRRSRTSRS